MPPPITTERLELRTYRPEDVDGIQAMLYGDPDVRRHTGGAWSLSATRATIAGYIALQDRCGYSYWAVLERGTGELVGEAGLKPLELNAQADVELGYAFRKASWGQGYATEVGRAVLDEAFGALGLERVFATVDDANAGSRHVLDKLGFAAAGSVVVDGVELLLLVLEGP